MNFVSIDFETANEKRSSPCAVGIVVANETDIIDEYYSLINPLAEFRSMNINIHGITPKQVENAPTFAELWPKLYQYLSKGTVIAHNASFDMSVMRHTLDYFHLPYPELDYLCTVAISKQMWPKLHNYKLNTLANYHRIHFAHHHALEDARVAAKIFIKALNVSEPGTLEGLLSACHLQSGKIYQHGYIAPKKRQKRQRKRMCLF
ncbi:3'-5' exonuclease [Virgibacillus proomii]|jgi:DNA polymerase III subunit epsilon|uniref:3'-5' exonuclease n=1 Tax=Virgibacillus proomii TaxID=84407 RepID=UPI000985F86E|nr:3'-5' exonuclease [Virgibacillus proomii]